AGDEVGGNRTYLGSVVNALICAGEGAGRLCINERSSSEEKRAFAALAEKSQHVSVHATVRSDTDLQEGPARIVTFSNGPLERNVMLGQEGRDLVFRIRTPRSGLNGVDMQFSLPEAIESGKNTRVTAEFKKGALFLSAEAGGVTRSGSYRPRLLQSSLEIRGKGEAHVPLVFLNRSGVVAFLLLLAGTAILIPARGALAVRASGKAIQGQIKDSTSPV
ncbi:MAG TPA: hypothetical protein VKZ59_14040, partial [Acidobacteriota bacterium]|nr:hypothetical protein [Acidobacteriota bacterium]